VRSRIALFLLASAVALVAAHLLDRAVFEGVVMRRIYENDLGRMFRVAGFLPLWGLMAIAFWLHDRRSQRPRAWRRGALLFAAAALGGILAEAIKIVVRRERPEAHAGAYVFRPWDVETLSTGGLGLPSSHALVAFAAAAMLSRLIPSAAPVWWIFAIGCGVTRIAAGAHFLSDIVAAAVVALALVWALWQRWGEEPATRSVPS
jgi:membrane-associated phospholipid phosphatase